MWMFFSLTAAILFVCFNNRETKNSEQHTLYVIYQYNAFQKKKKLKINVQLRINSPQQVSFKHEYKSKMCIEARLTCRFWHPGQLTACPRLQPNLLFVYWRPDNGHYRNVNLRMAVKCLSDCFDRCWAAGRPAVVPVGKHVDSNSNNSSLGGEGCSCRLDTGRSTLKRRHNCWLTTCFLSSCRSACCGCAAQCL